MLLLLFNTTRVLLLLFNTTRARARTHSGPPSSSSSSRSTRRETRTNLLPAAGTRDTIGLAPRDDNERSMQMPKVV